MLSTEAKTGAYAQTLHHITALIKERFVQKAKFYNTLFYICTACICLEIIGCIVSSKSAFAFGVCASLTIITLLLSYIGWRFFSEKRLEECDDILKIFIKECRTTFSAFESAESTHLIESEAARMLAQELEDIFATLMPIAKESLKPAFLKLSAQLHGWALFQMRLHLLEHAAEMIVDLIIEKPIEAAYHKKLAIVYLEIACLYAEPSSLNPDTKNESWSQGRYKEAVVRAVCALQVASEFDSDDAWIFEQLIECYGALKNRAKQLEVCKHLLVLRPDHPDTLERVGKRYFEHGLHAEGLKIYERLKFDYPKRAQKLLQDYRAAFSHTELT